MKKMLSAVIVMFMVSGSVFAADIIRTESELKSMIETKEIDNRRADRAFRVFSSALMTVFIESNNFSDEIEHISAAAWFTARVKPYMNDLKGRFFVNNSSEENGMNYLMYHEDERETAIAAKKDIGDFNIFFSHFENESLKADVDKSSDGYISISTSLDDRYNNIRKDN